MATNTVKLDPSVLVPFWMGLPEEERNKYNPREPEGLLALHEAYTKSQAKETQENGSKERKTPESKHYTVLLLVHDGDTLSTQIVGGGLAARGQGGKDVTKNELAMAESIAETSAIMARAEGKLASFFRIETEKLGDLV